ncbi:MAG: FAD binding domain-containing protein [Candidatus Omnitrophota bacterium]
MLLNPLEFHKPATLQAAVKLYSELPDARLLAGGTFLLNSLKTMKRRGNKTPSHVISLKHIPDLHGIAVKDEKLFIGSAVVINDLFASSLLTDNFALLRIVCRNISTNPIRNMATVGGNLTSRYTWTELGAALIALKADMHFVGPDLKEEVLSVEDFFANNARTNKILRAISIIKDKKIKSSYQRVKKLSDVDVPLLAVCVTAQFSGNHFKDTRVVINSGTAFAKRDLVLEKFLNESSAHKNLAQEALDHLDTPIYDTRSDDYKKAMFRVGIKNAINELISGREK